jgi:hypothetical protein
MKRVTDQNYVKCLCGIADNKKEWMKLRMNVYIWDVMDAMDGERSRLDPQRTLPQEVRRETANLETLEVEAWFRFVRVALGALLEGEDLLHDVGHDAELVHVDEWGEG